MNSKPLKPGSGEDGDLPDFAGWRELARQIEQEKDHDKLMQLVEQLITKFDDEQRSRGELQREDSSVTGGV